MVELSGESSNHQLDTAADLTAVFETLADWEAQLKPHRHELFERRDAPEMGGPTP